MIKFVSILCLSLSFVFCFSQSNNEDKYAQSRFLQKANTAGAQAESFMKQNIALDVLFAANEDCDLFINNELKGAVSKTKYLYLKLALGKYSYRARSKVGADELKDSFEVREGVANEVFIDLLYVIDENNKEKSSVASIANNVPASQPANESADNSREQTEKAAINELLSNMVKIKGGSFTMGNNKSLVGDEIEHAVSINSLMFSKYEVTQQQWLDIMGYNPSENKGCANCPVENVSWEDAMKFIQKINVIGDKRFRLPTEAEWEYVAKIGGKSEIEEAGGQEEYIKKTAWYFANSDKKTHQVGEKQPNASGIFDLYGNVSEWCSDWYASYYYKEDYNQRNPYGPPLGKEKVLRGGSFLEYVGDRFRPSLRNKLKPTTKSNDVGFRLVMDVY